MKNTEDRRSTYQFLFKPYAIEYIKQNKNQWNLGRPVIVEPGQAGDSGTRAGPGHHWAVVYEAGTRHYITLHLRIEETLYTTLLR